MLIEILEKAKIERNVEARKKLVKDAQRHLGDEMHMIRDAGGATGYWLAWPAVQNYRVYEGDNLTRLRNLWLDQTKAPFV